MRFGYKTVILGGSVTGVLTLRETDEGIRGRVKTSAAGEDLRLAIFEGENAFAIDFVDFEDFGLPRLNVNNLNVYIVQDGKIVAHGKTAFKRLGDAFVTQKVRSLCHDEKKKTAAENFSDALSLDASPAPDAKPKITDYFFTIERYDDDAIAEVNYFEKAASQTESPISAVAALPTDSADPALTAEANDDEGNNEGGKRRGIKGYGYEGRPLPSAFERGFLSGEFYLKNAEATHRERLKRDRTEHKRKSSLAKISGKEKDSESDFKEVAAGKTPIASAIEADFFEEVSAQLDTLMKTHKHEERLEKLLPASKWITIPLERGESYVLGTLADIYIMYGVPSSDPNPPKELKGAVRLSVEEDGKITYFYILIQDAKTGKSI